MRRFVLDASVTLAWFVDTPISSYAEQVAKRVREGDRPFVPALWHLEVANGLLVALRRQVITSNDAAAALDRLDTMSIHLTDTHAEIVPAKRVFATAKMFQLSSYDAVYLDLARSEDLPLATLDLNLAKAAKQCGIRKFE